MDKPADYPKIRVMVLMGGVSGEREVSLVSGEACAEALERLGHQVIRYDVTADIPSLVGALASEKPDLVFNALHGKFGEDGRIQGLLDLMGLAYTHCDYLSSALAMDKPLAVQLLRQAGLPVASGEVFKEAKLLRLNGKHARATPYVIKPAREGSALGVIIVAKDDPPPNLGNWVYGDALIEDYIAGRELTVTVMGGKALAVTELRPKQGFYDYQAKYTQGMAQHLCPAPLSPETYQRCLIISEAAALALRCRGVVRVDLRYDETGEGGIIDRLAILEVNTQPGMTPLSLVPEQAKLVGMDFDALVQWIIDHPVIAL